MIISLFSKKGGVGKTPIAASLACDLDLYLLSNDDSVIETVFPGRAKIQEDLPLIENCVYDFGGFVEAGVRNILKHSNLVIVPCFADIDALKSTIKTIEEIKPFAKNIIVVATRTEKSDDLELIETSIKKYFPEIEIFELKKSRIFSTVLESGQSIRSIVDDGAFTRYTYRTVATQYEKLINHIGELTK